MEYSKLKKDLIAILKLDKEAMLKVSLDKDATKFGIIIFFVPAVVNLILASFTFPSGFGVIFSRFMLWPMLIPVFSIVLSVVLMSFVAVKFFNGKGGHIEFFRTVSYSSVVLWISIIPFLLGMLGILDPLGLYNLIWLIGVVWILAVSYRMLLIHHKVTENDAYWILGIGVLGYFLFKKILGAILVSKQNRNVLCFTK